VKQLTPRKFERNRCLGQASVRPLPGDTSFRAEVLNLGQGGMGLFSNRFLEVGRQIEVTLQVRGKTVAADVATRDGRIAAAKVLPDGNIMGIAFSRPLSAAELKSLEENIS